MKMMLEYMRLKPTPLTLRVSQVLLVFMVVAVPLMWLMASRTLDAYFYSANNGHALLRSARNVSSIIDTLPQMVLMTGAAVGGTLAALHWRLGTQARVLTLMHVAVYGVSLFYLVENMSW
jgi:hypothetical protein